VGAAHLPKQGGHTGPQPPPHLPRQRHGVTPQMRGRYPDYDVLDSVRHWDEPTRRVVLERVAQVPAIRFFEPAEARTLAAFCDVVTAQHAEPRIPVLAMVDAKFCAGELDGFRHHDLPPDPETWRRAAALLDRSAREAGSEDGFAGAGSQLQHELVERFAKGELDWDLPVQKAWSVLMRGVLGAFYSHPWAWNEIGFGGPAHPRGFARLGEGQREQWERPEEFVADPVEDVHERGLE